MLVMNFFFILLSFFIGMPFYTLLERKILSYIQIRKGPKKVSFGGFLQPVSDGVKLLIKGRKILEVKNLVYWLGSFSIFFIMMLSWFTIPLKWKYLQLNLCVLLVLCVNSLSVYGLLSSGWSSNSKYSFLGSIRAGAQTVSYEVSLFILFLFFCFPHHCFNMKYFVGGGFLLSFVFLSLIYLISILAETKRSPFDFAEGESELVSGFKTEFSSVGFVFLFLGEYGLILFFCLVGGVFCLGMNWLMTFFPFLLFINFFLMVRGSFPRFRYDFLMGLVWKVLLPLVMCWYWLILLV